MRCRWVMLVSAGESQNLPGPLAQAEAVAAHLGAYGDDGPGDPAGRERGPMPEAASPEDTMADFAGYVVNRLFSVGLSLDSAYSIAGPGPAGDRVAAAADEVDRLIREIRDHVFAGRARGA